YLLPHARAAFGLMGANEKVEDAKHVLRWLKANSGSCVNCAGGVAVLSKREIFRGCQGRWPTVAEMEPVLALLESHKYLVALPEKERGRPGRRPSPEYALNPRHFRAAGQAPTDTIDTIDGTDPEGGA